MKQVTNFAPGAFFFTALWPDGYPDGSRSDSCYHSYTGVDCLILKLILNFVLITNLCLLFIESNAASPADNARSSSGSRRGRGGTVGNRGGRPRGQGRVGEFRPGEVPLRLITRVSNGYINFMEHDVHLWLFDRPTENGCTVENAYFEGNTLPHGQGSTFYRNNNFLVRLASIGGYQTVIYVRQNGSLMGVRAPRPTRKELSINYVTDFLANFFFNI